MKYNSKDTTTFLEATREGHIGEQQLLEEVLPLMEEYFVGNIVSQENNAFYQLPNGQIFQITLVEVGISQ